MDKIYHWVQKHPGALKKHLLLLLGLTALLAAIGASAKINSFIDHPQFTHWDYFNEIYEAFMQDKKGLYFAFFIVDAVWAPILLSSLAHMLMRLKLHSSATLAPTHTIATYTGVAAFAYLADLTEGVMYSFGIDDSLRYVVVLKTVLYVCALLVFLFGVLKYWNRIEEGKVKARQLKAIRTFLSTSFLSIILIVIVGGLLTALDQGVTIVVELFFQPINLVLMLPLLFLIAVVISHYPAYFEARQKCLKAHVDWKMYDWKFFHVIANWTGFGIVHYVVKPDEPVGDCCDDLDPQSPFDPIAKACRHHLGSLLFVAFLYVLLFTGAATFDFPSAGAISGVVFIASIIFYNWARNVRTKDRLANPPGRASKISKWYLRSAILSIVLLGVTMILDLWLEWNRWTLVLCMLTVVSSIGTYITFRLARKEYYNTNNLWLVKRIFVGGTFTMILLVVANFWLPYAIDHLNPITIILMYLLNFYGLVAVGTKHVQFYAEVEDEKEGGEETPRAVRRNRYLRYALPMLPVFLFLWSFISAPINSDLHYLKKVEESDGETMSFSRFKEVISDRDSLYTEYIMTTSYGGGLMADVWAMLVYNELQQRCDEQFLSTTLNMSANSGGAIGIGNYANLWANSMTLKGEAKYQTIDTAIQKIGNFNHLAIDLTYILGMDLVRELLPFFTWNGKDRSYEAMKRYAIMTGDEEALSLDSRSFRAQWKSIFEASEYYPTLAISTIATDGEFGNAFSLKDMEEHKKAFRGIYNILDIDGTSNDSTISYYGGLSTSNRFPVFSPTASIAGEGHFLDGGYYDNSGLMNSLEWLNYMLLDTALLDTAATPIKYVMINNSRSKYIKYLLRSWVDEEKDIKGTGELAAILKTVTTVDKVSTHLEEVVRSYDPNPAEIYLPLRFTFDDVVNTFGGKLPEPFLIQQIIDKNNAEIDTALLEANAFYKEGWGIVESPTARLLSNPAVQYQKAMIEFHPRIQEEIQKIAVCQQLSTSPKTY